jgi:hypothetical protein
MGTGTAGAFGWAFLAGFTIAAFPALRYWWHRRHRKR